MQSRESLLESLRKNADGSGRVQITFPEDIQEKRQILKLLSDLEEDGEIRRLSATIGYRIYEV